MKKYILIIAGIFCINFLVSGKKTIDTHKDLGLVAHLTGVKIIAEFKMISLIQKSAEVKDKPDTLNPSRLEYNFLRLSVEMLINQLSADMINKNKVRKYNKISRYVAGDADVLSGKLNAYKRLLDEIDERFWIFITGSETKFLADVGMGDILDAVELGHTIITDARDFREKKVSNLITQLKDLKLQSLKDLTEPKDK